MKAIEIINALKGKKGQHVQAVWSRKADTLKDCPFTITKRTAAWVRSGIQYANLTNVKNAIQSGERGEVGKLPFGQWAKGYENYIIIHTPKGATAPVEYVRLYPATFENLSHPHVEWTMDGIPATFEQVEPYLKASEKRKEDEQPACFTLRADSILEIAGE